VGSVAPPPEFAAEDREESCYDRCSRLGDFSTREYLIASLGLGCLAMFARRRSWTEAPLLPESPSIQVSKRRRISSRLIKAQPAKPALISPLSKPTCSAEEKEKIAEIVNILNDYSTLTIGGMMGRLDTLKQEISNVHPLAFLETIFSNEDLKNKMRNIFQDSWKFLQQNGFLGGIAEGLGSRRLEELDPYLDDWAQSLRTTKETVRSFIELQDWKGLTDHLSR